MIPLTPKEIVIRIARRVLGENRVHDYLIRRGIELRHLQDGYSGSETAECREGFKGDCAKHQTLIFMADGKWMHGGLTDRLRGMASAYRFAKEHQLEFKIFHTSPFELQQILQPNNVHWNIDKSEISYDSTIAKPVLLYREDFENDSALERQLDKSHTQFHLYSCVDTVNEKFPEYINELFKPSPLLSQELAHYENLLGTNYTAISFRFQNKLGDFKEFTFSELPDAGKQELLKASLDAIKREIAQNSNKIPASEGMTNRDNKILVTADSPTFLAEVEKMPNVVTVKGKSIHIDFNKSKNASDYLKAFTEFYLISRASKAKLYHNRKYKTYPSNFPKYAALLGHLPYEIIEG